VRDTGAGQVIYIGMSFYSYNSEMARLLANAVEWSGSRFLSMEPDSGTVPPGSTQDVTIRFNAQDLWGGDYDGSVNVWSNDPVNDRVNVPVSLHVVGKPLIAVDPDTIDFGRGLRRLPGRLYSPWPSPAGGGRLVYTGGFGVVHGCIDRRQQ